MNYGSEFQNKSPPLSQGEEEEVADVGFRSNFKKIPTLTQDHGDA